MINKEGYVAIDKATGKMLYTVFGGPGGYDKDYLTEDVDKVNLYPNLKAAEDRADRYNYNHKTKVEFKFRKAVRTIKQRKPTLEEIKWVLQYLDEELLVEGTFEEVCEYINQLEERE
jgi:hypothetical protein